ncbi:MAG: hypothetical protein ACRD4T_00185 [Candidatus Acidiferrales bacterium]
MATATTPAQICNVALLRAGSKAFIASLTEASIESQICAKLYDMARDAVLAERPWRFATKTETLALTPLVHPLWAFVYDAPSDCIPDGSRHIMGATRNPGRNEQIPLATQDAPTYGLVLLTNQENAVLIYTARVEEVKFSPLFVDALAWKLAPDIAMGLSVKPAVGVKFLDEYRIALDKAFAADLASNVEDVHPEASHVRARG